MESEYRRNSNRNYLVLPEKDGDYQMEMVLRNRAEGFIPVKRAKWDGEDKLYYDITGKVTLEKGFLTRKITYKELSDILFSISSMVKECKRLFIDTSGIIVSPEYIYRDGGSENIYWIFYPYDNNSNNLLDLAEFVLEHIDNENPSVVKTACEMYKRIKEGSLETENLYEILYSNFDDTSKETKEDKDIKQNTEKKPSLPRADKLPENESKLKSSNILEQTVEKVFSQFFKKKYQPEDYLPKDNEFYDYRIHDDEDEEYTEYDYDYAPTVLMNIPQDNVRRLVSRNHGVPDAELKVFPCIIGSRRDCVDILINDKSVSRMHAQIDESNGRLFIYDLNSSNGTFVNGEKISKIEKEISQGDEITIGSVRYVLG